MSSGFELPKILRWPGGSRRFQSLLLRYVPAHRVYVEPFCGGASLFFAKEPAEVSVLGDTDPRVIETYERVRRGEILKCPLIVPNSRELYDRLKGTEPWDDLCGFLALSKLSYDGRLISFRTQPGPDYRTYDPKHIKQQIAMLRSAYLILGDFATTMRKFDSKDTFHYVDPPWYMPYADEVYHTGISVTPDEIYQVCSRMKGKVMIVYNHHPVVQEALCRPPFRCGQFSRRANGRHGMRTMNMILAMNY